MASHIDVPEENNTILVAMMEQKGVIIELYQVTKKEMDEHRSRKDGHVDHIAFDVADVNMAFRELREAGFTMVEEKPVFLDFWENGCKYFAKGFGWGKTGIQPDYVKLLCTPWI